VRHGVPTVRWRSSAWWDAVRVPAREAGWCCWSSLPAGRFHVCHEPSSGVFFWVPL
jgi:hypothetical protein